MKPVAIFRHAPVEGPGYFATFLDAAAIRHELVAVDEGAAVPVNPSGFSGLVFMGGPMSVNGTKPWIPAELELIRRAVQEGVPVLGHCLGGQLMAKALGAAVRHAAAKEIGWGRVEVAAGPVAADWFGAGVGSFDAFHWHGETFDIPEGATRVLTSPWCANQAFVSGPHLALQCHVEMTVEMVEAWCAAGQEEIAAAGSPAVQAREQIVDRLPQRVETLNRYAARLYTRWIAGLQP